MSALSLRFNDDERFERFQAELGFPLTGRRLGAVHTVPVVDDEKGVFFRLKYGPEIAAAETGDEPVAGYWNLYSGGGALAQLNQPLGPSGYVWVLDEEAIAAARALLPTTVTPKPYPCPTPWKRKGRA